MKKELIKYLSEYITPERQMLFDKVLKSRTRHITVVLEDIFQPQNASAVLRSCDCFGIQDVHIIENRNKFTVSENVSLGSSKWLNLNTYDSGSNNTLECINKLKDDGYRIIATTPHTEDINLEDFNISGGKSAIVFGTELSGITDTVKENADEFLKIPMYGFTESFNISVSAAIILHHLSHKLRDSGIAWELSEDEKDQIMLEWIGKTLKKANLLEKRFYANKNM
jgi:tRNA (guanosine-2'-O-)-methyltransferase